MTMIPEVDAHQAKALLDEGVTFLDVRQTEDYLQGHLPGAHSVDDQEIQTFLQRFPRDRRIVVYCYAGNFSRGAVSFLKQKGFRQVWTLWGGIEHFKEHYGELLQAGDPIPVPYP